MTDQANTLRVINGGRGADVISLVPRRERAIAITGGKGGVGKSTIALNLAMAYAKSGGNVLIVDTDLGMADLNLLLGVAPDKSMLDVLTGTPVEDAIVEAHGIHLLPALNGSHLLERAAAHARLQVFEAIESLGDRFDTLVLDIAAGVGGNQTAFAGSVPETLVVATPEPLSLADAYACLKVLALEQGLTHAYIVPNRVTSRSQAEEIVNRLSALVARFLDMQLSPLPPIPYDPMVAEAAELGIPFLKHRPESPASRGVRQLARQLDALAVPDEREGVVRLFWRNTFAAEGAVQ